MKILARLTAQTPNLSPATTGLSSSVPLTRTELADVLKGLTPWQLETIYAIELGEKAAIHRLLAHTWAWFRRYYLVRYCSWPNDATKHDALFKVVAGITRIVVAHPHGVFCRCGGGAHCTRCHGTGIVNFTTTQLAKESGVSRRTLYTEKYKIFISDIYENLMLQYTDALAHIRKRVRLMREEDEKCVE